MNNYCFDYEVQVDPEDVLDSLSILQIKEYLIRRKTLFPDDKDTGADIELEEWERKAILKVLIAEYCPKNLQSVRESVKEAFDRMMEEYLEY